MFAVPLYPITPFNKDEAEAIRLAETTARTSVRIFHFYKDYQRVHRVAARLEAGMVWVNSSNDSDPRVPFGGVKQSGIGRELGEAGLAAYTQVKAVHVNMGQLL